MRKEWKARGMPGTPGHFDLSAIAQWYAEDIKRRAKKTFADPSGDPDLADFDSPNLERYRGHKADLAELELMKKRGELIDRPAVRDGLARVAAVLRGAGEKIQERYGVEAAAILEDALASCDSEAEAMFGGPVPNEQDESDDEA